MRKALLSVVLLAASVWPVLAASEDVAPDASSVCPLLPGAQVPAVSLLDFSGQEVMLRAEIGESPAVLIFFRGGW